MKICYPVKIHREDGGYIATFPDFDEAFTEGDTLDEALFNAAEVLSLTLQGRIEDGFDIPAPSSLKGTGVHWVTPEADIQVAVLVHQMLRVEGKNLSDLARALDTSWAAVQRLEKPGSNPTLKRLSAVAAQLGKRLVVSFE